MNCFALLTDYFLWVLQTPEWASNTLEIVLQNNTHHADDEIFPQPEGFSVTTASPDVLRLTPMHGDPPFGRYHLEIILNAASNDAICVYIRGPSSHIPALCRSLNIEVSSGYFNAQLESCSRETPGASFWRFTEAIPEEKVDVFIRRLPMVKTCHCSSTCSTTMQSLAQAHSFDATGAS